MRKRALLVATLGLCVMAPAQAADEKNLLYVKARNTRMMASSAPTAGVVAILQPGQQVKWLGADKKAPQWHRVEASGKQGLVFQSNLSKKPPSRELLAKDGGTPVEAGVYASSTSWARTWPPSPSAPHCATPSAS